MSERYVGRRITPSVKFVEFTCILLPTEANQKEGSGFLTTTLTIVLVWHMQMQEFQKPNYPSLSNKRVNERVINQLKMAQHDTKTKFVE